MCDYIILCKVAHLELADCVAETIRASIASLLTLGVESYLVAILSFN